MFYKGEEILARVWESHSNLYTLTKSGKLDKSLDIQISNEDAEILWYEVAEMSHLDCSRGTFIEIPTIEEAKLRIDAYRKENPDDYS